MLRDQFFSDPMGYGAIRTKRTFDATWEAIKKYEATSGKTLDSMTTREDYVELLNNLGIRRASVFSLYKSNILAYLRYMESYGVISKEQIETFKSLTSRDIAPIDKKTVSGDEKIGYHRDINALRDAIHDTIRVGAKEDASLYDLHASICYLAWYGLSIDQILNLKKADVLADGILLDGKKIEMAPCAYLTLNSYRDAEGFNQRARGVILHKYKWSEYLLRSEQSAQFNLRSLRMALRRFNEICEGQYSLTYDVIHRSGVFYRAYVAELNGISVDPSDAEAVSRTFCEDLSQPSKRQRWLQDYACYKQLFNS